MNRTRKVEYSPFKDRIKDRRVFETPQRRTERRRSVYVGQVAGVLARLG